MGILDKIRKFKRRRKIRKALKLRVDFCIDLCRHLRKYEKVRSLWHTHFDSNMSRIECGFATPLLASVNSHIISKMHITKDTLTQLIRIEFRTVNNNRIDNLPDIVLNLDYDIIYGDSKSLHLLNLAYNMLVSMYENEQMRKEIVETFAENEIDLWEDIN